MEKGVRDHIHSVVCSHSSWSHIQHHVEWWPICVHATDAVRRGNFFFCYYLHRSSEPIQLTEEIFNSWRRHNGARSSMPFESTKLGRRSGYLCCAVRVLSTALCLVSRGFPFWCAIVRSRSWGWQARITGLCLLGTRWMPQLTSSSLYPCATTFDRTATK